MVPAAVVVLIGAVGASFALLDAGAAFAVIALLIVIGLGAAPVVFSVVSRRRDPSIRSNQSTEEDAAARIVQTKTDRAD